MNYASVLGSPIQHSLSPAMHTAAYQALGLQDWEYQRHEVNEETLGDFLSQCDKSWRGLSLTMPLKQKILSFGSSAQEEVSLLGVGNTAIFHWDDVDSNSCNPSPIEQEKLPQGLRIDVYNTDVKGIELALLYHDATLPQQIENAVFQADTPVEAVVIGAGSTARSALAALRNIGVKNVAIVARNLEKAHRSCDSLIQQLNIQACYVSFAEALSIICSAVIVVSTLPQHAADSFAETLSTMLTLPNCSSDSTRCSLASVQPPILLDVVYDPSPTALMNTWNHWNSMVEANQPVIGGEYMLLWQGVYQVSLMTDTPLKAVPVEAMLQALKRGLHHE